MVQQTAQILQDFLPNLLMKLSSLQSLIMAVSGEGILITQHQLPDILKVQKANYQ